jgi:hypothetical protein
LDLQAKDISSLFALSYWGSPVVKLTVPRAKLRGRRLLSLYKGEKGAANLLQLNPSTLRTKMRKLDIPFGKKSRAYLKGIQ